MASTAQLTVEYKKISEIKPYDDNPRRNDGAVKAVAKSIKRFGFRQPIIVDKDGVIIAGHTRYKAARKLGITEIPVHVADLDEAAARAYRLVDNQTAGLAEWDLGKLEAEFNSLKDIDCDLSEFEGIFKILNSSQSPAEDIDSHWEGMPDFSHEEQNAYKTIKMYFLDQASVDAFSRLIKQSISEKTKYLYFPKQVKKQTEQKRYKCES